MAAAFRLPSSWCMAESHLEGPSFRVLHDAVLRRLKASDTEQFATPLKSSSGVEEMSCMVLAPPYPMASSVAGHTPAKSISPGPIDARSRPVCFDLSRTGELSRDA